MTLVRECTKDNTHTKIANDYNNRQPTVINVFAISFTILGKMYNVLGFCLCIQSIPSSKTELQYAAAIET